MKKSMMLAVVIAAFMALQANAFAKTVEGTVASVDAAAKKLSVSVADASGTAAEVSIAVNESTTYAGVASLEALTQGAKVTVEANEDANGGWTASSVQIPAAASAAQ